MCETVGTISTLRAGFPFEIGYDSGQKREEEER